MTRQLGGVDLLIWKMQTTLIVSSLVLVSVPALIDIASAQTPPLDYSRDCTSSGCHADLIKTKVVHAPVAAKECDACHQPDFGELSRVAGTGPHKFTWAAEQNELCYECHDEDEFDGKVKHAPMEQGQCTACHDPHGGAHRMNLVMTQPQLCFECHDEVADSVEDADIVHGALASDRKCTACHNPHAADVKSILIQQSMELCLSCHDDAIEAASGTAGNIAALLKENPEHHGPVGNGNCLACHSPHASEQFRLLNAAYPRSFYAKFEEDTYALCFDCHDIEIFEDEHTGELTEFRNGNVNLHYLHVNRPVKGRTCRACHDPHAAKNKKMIAESVAFGGWRIPLNYQSTASGGSCLPGCHKTYRYDRENAVANLSR